jgi:hypothetical protein
MLSMLQLVCMRGGGCHGSGLALLLCLHRRGTHAGYVVLNSVDVQDLGSLVCPIGIDRNGTRDERAGSRSGWNSGQHRGQLVRTLRLSTLRLAVRANADVGMRCVEVLRF